MGIFHRNRAKNQDEPNSMLESIAQKNSAIAVDWARDFDKVLDYSQTGIADVEEILDYYSKAIPSDQPTEQEIWNMAIIFGSYLGEVLLKNGLRQKGYRWSQTDGCDIPLLREPNGWMLTPIDRVYKRLVNGSEDSVVSFYRYAITL